MLRLRHLIFLGRNGELRADGNILWIVTFQLFGTNTSPHVLKNTTKYESCLGRIPDSPLQTGLSMLWCCKVGTANHVPGLLSQIAEVLLWI